MKKILIGISFILITWFLFSQVIIKNPFLLPAPQSVFIAFFHLLCDGVFFNDIGLTLFKWVTGLALGISTGVIIGFAMAYSKIIDSLIDFPVDFFRSIPVTSIFPIFLLIAGISNSSQIAMVWAAVVFIQIVNTQYGFKQISQDRILMARTFQATSWQIFKDIIFWETLPYIFVGIRTSISTSLIVIIVSEMFIGTKYGLGQRLWDAYSTNSIETMYAIVLLTGLMGYTMSALFKLLDAKIIFWNKPQQ